MRTKQLAALALLGCFTHMAIAQSPAPTGIPGAVPAALAKPTVETATTPVEQIKLNGISVPLNIRTLAEMQRLNEEKELRQKLQETLITGGTLQIPSNRMFPASNSTSPTQSTPTNTALTETAPQPRRARPVVPVNTLMAIYGPDNNLKAEVFVGKQEARQLKKGDSFGNFRVASISQNGIQLEPLSGSSSSSRFIPVGQRLSN